MEKAELKEFQQIMATIFIENYEKELRSNQLDKIIEDALNNLNVDRWKPALEAIGIRQIQYLYTALYTYLLTAFDINLLECKLNLKDEASLDVLDTCVQNNETIINIPKNPPYRVAIRNFSKYRMRIYFDNSLTSLPENISISLSYVEGATEIYLPDNLSGNLNLDELFKTRLYGSWSKTPIGIYFKPVVRDGELESDFVVSNLQKYVYLPFFRVKKAMVESAQEKNLTSVEKYSNEWYKEKSKECRKLFCGYSGLPETKKLTVNDINYHKFGAFNRVSREMGFSEELLKETLLELDT